MRVLFSDEQLIDTTSKVTSLQDLILRLGYKHASTGCYRTVKKALHRLQIDSSHFRIKVNYESPSYHAKYLTSSARRKFISERGNKCEECGLETWREKPAALEVHHLDGNQINSQYDNLQVLCLQCHAQTPNWRGRRTKETCKLYIKDKVKKISLCACGCKKDLKAKTCSKCYRLTSRVFEVTKEELELLIAQHSWVAIGKMFGVSDNAIRKRAKLYGLLR